MEGGMKEACELLCASQAVFKVYDVHRPAEQHLDICLEQVADGLGT